MNKKYLKYLTKKNLVLFLVLTILFTIIFAYELLTCHLYHPENNGTWYRSEDVNTLGSGLLYIYYPMMAFVIFISFKANLYKYKKNSSDCFYHLPLNRKSIRRHHHLFYMVLILAIFTLSYWISIGLFGIRYVTETAPIYTSGENAVKYVYRFGYYAAAYLPLCVIFIFAYLFNSTFIQMGNSFVTSAVFLILGTYVVSIFPTVITSLVNKYSSVEFSLYPNAFISLLTQGYLPHFPFTLVDATLGNYIVGCDHIDFKDFNLMPTILESIMVVIMLGLSIIYNFFVDDPSGEYSGTPGARNKYYSLIIASSFLINAISNASTRLEEPASYYSLIGIILNLILTPIVIYLIYVILNKTFKIKKYELFYIIGGFIILLIGVGFAFIPGYKRSIEGTSVYLNMIY